MKEEKMNNVKNIGIIYEKDESGVYHYKKTKLFESNAEINAAYNNYNVISLNKQKLDYFYEIIKFLFLLT